MFLTLVSEVEVVVPVVSVLHVDRVRVGGDLLTEEGVDISRYNRYCRYSYISIHLDTVYMPSALLLVSASTPWLERKTWICK